MGAKTTSKGARTQQAILEAALSMAEVDGLEGLSFGRVAKTIGMSKSGLFSHFKTKEELQLAVYEHAVARFGAAVVEPILGTPEGLPRLWHLCESWLDYAYGGVFEHGCFFTAVAAEYQSRPGAIRERMLRGVVEFNVILRQVITRAIELGHLREDVDVPQLAFEVHSFMGSANSGHQLFGTTEPLERAWTGIRARLLGVLSEGAPTLPGLQQPRPRGERATPKSPA